MKTETEVIARKLTVLRRDYEKMRQLYLIANVKLAQKEQECEELKVQNGRLQKEIGSKG